MKSRLSKYAHLFIKWETAKLVFSLGFVAGMIAMAFLLTSAKALEALTSAVQ